MYLIICVQMRWKSNYFIKLVFPFLWQFSSNWPQLSSISFNNITTKQNNVYFGSNKSVCRRKFRIFRKDVAVDWSMQEARMQSPSSKCIPEIESTKKNMDHNLKSSDFETVVNAIQHYGTYGICLLISTKYPKS